VSEPSTYYALKVRALYLIIVSLVILLMGTMYTLTSRVFENTAKVGQLEARVQDQQVVIEKLQGNFGKMYTAFLRSLRQQ
jgi:hypothetical protein